jgi:hypothetical protein
MFSYEAREMLAKKYIYAIKKYHCYHYCILIRILIVMTMATAFNANAINMLQ